MAGTLAGVLTGGGMTNINSVGSNYGMTGLPPDVALEEQALNRKQQIANLLLQRGLQGAQGQMAGRFYVAPSWAQGLAQLGSAAAGATLSSDIDGQRQALAATMNKERERAIQDYIKRTSPTETQPEMPVDSTLVPNTFDIEQLQPDQQRQQIRQQNQNAYANSAAPSEIASGALTDKMNAMGRMVPDPQMSLPDRSIPVGAPVQTPADPRQSRQAVLEALSHTDPRVRSAVTFLEQQKAQEADKEAQRTFLAALTGQKQAGQEKIEGIKGANQIKAKETVSGDAKLSQQEQNKRTDLGKIEQINELLDGMDPQSDEAKVLQALRTKLSTHRPSDSTTVNVDQAVPFVTELQKKTADNVAEAQKSAEASQEILSTISRIDEAIKTGKVIAGPTATPKIYLRQLSEVLGIGGKDNEEVLQNTRVAIQGMAKLQIATSQQAQGQGAISDYERRLFEKASAGQDLTTPEITALLQGMKKMSEWTIAKHDRNVGLVKELPKGGKLLAPFMELNGGVQPPAREGVSRPGQVRKFNPATGMIE